MGLFQQLLVFTRCCASLYLAVAAVAHRGWEVCLWAGELESAIRDPNMCTHTHFVGVRAGHLYVLVNNVCVCMSVSLSVHVCVCVFPCMLGCQVCDSWSLCILSRLWLMTHHHDNIGGRDAFIHTMALLGPSLTLCHLIHWEGQQLALTPALCAC